jgi:nucleotide-binding universal stress UspA family protein
MYYLRDAAAEMTRESETKVQQPAMKDYLIGANAAKVVRHPACSVLVVREP